MKRWLSFALALLLFAGLAACGRPDGGDTAALPSAAEETEGQHAAAPAVQTRPGYLPAELSMPDWLEFYDRRTWDTCGDTIWLAGKGTQGEPLAVAFDTRSESWQRVPLATGQARCPSVRRISVVGETLWALLLEGASEQEIASGAFPRDLGYYVLNQNLSDGSAQCTRVPFSGVAGTESSSPTFVTLLALSDERALLTSFGECYVIDAAANLLEKPDFPLSGYLDPLRVDGALYLYRDDTNEGYARFDPATLTLEDGAVPLEVSYSFGSNAGHFLTEQNGALCRYDPASGACEEIFRWMDVALSWESRGGQICFENSAGVFFYPTDNGLVRVQAGQVPDKRVLTLACFGDASDENYEWLHGDGLPYMASDELMDAIIRFNNTDPAYRVEVRPFVYENEAERSRMLVELATDSGIDLIDTSLLPERALKAGVLRDLLPLLDADESIGREDFIAPLFDAMLRDGGLYEYTDKFTMLSLFTAAALFPGKEGWTAEAIRTLAAQHPERRLPDRERLREPMVWAAAAEFIDWETASCSFDSLAFVNWLSLLKFLPEQAQTDEAGTMLFSVEQNLCDSFGYFGRVQAGGDYTVAGFPESSGTGSYFYRMSSEEMPAGELPMGVTLGRNTRIGVMASCANPDGAWRFVRTLMRGPDRDDIAYGIPVLKERFERTLAASIRTTGGALGYEDFNAADADALRAQVYATDKLVRADETLLTLIRSEIDAFLGGSRTAEEAARQLQSRVGLYLSEQA